MQYAHALLLLTCIGHSTRLCDQFQPPPALISLLHARAAAKSRLDPTLTQPTSGRGGGFRATPTQFGGDPTGVLDSTGAVLAALAVCLKAANRTSGTHSARFPVGAHDAGGCILDLDGGEWLVSAPVVIPTYVSNMQISGGSLVANSKNMSSVWTLMAGAGGGATATPRYLIEIGGTEPCVDSGPLKVKLETHRMKHTPLHLPPTPFYKAHPPTRAPTHTRTHPPAHFFAAC